MAISKKQRQQVYDKSGGVCWYCGEPLKKGWHVDHLEPVVRGSKVVKDNSNSPYSHKLVSDGTMRKPELDTLTNMVPSCAPCNIFKFTYSIEDFRQEIEAQKVRVLKQSSGSRIAERFGILEIKNIPVKFWFETQD